LTNSSFAVLQTSDSKRGVSSKPILRVKSILPCSAYIQKSNLNSAFALERFAVGALVYGGISFVRAYGYRVERTIFGAITMVRTLVYCAADGAVVMRTIH